MTRIGSWITFTFWVVLLQIFVLSYVEVGGYLSPYLYPLILVLAPANFNRYGLLMLSSLLGLGIDLHEGSGGLHPLDRRFEALAVRLDPRALHGAAL